MLTETRRLVLEQRLSAAEDAWHKLNLGQLARVFVDQNGERVEYTAATREGLRTYIAQLQAELAGGGPNNYPGPFELVFL